MGEKKQCTLKGEEKRGGTTTWVSRGALLLLLLQWLILLSVILHWIVLLWAKWAWMAQRIVALAAGAKSTNHNTCRQKKGKTKHEHTTLSAVLASRYRACMERRLAMNLNAHRH